MNESAKQKNTKFWVIALAAVLCIAAVWISVNTASNPDYLYEVLWNFDADEGEAYARLEGTTLIVTSRPGFGKEYLQGNTFEEQRSSITKVVIQDEIAPTHIYSWFSGMTNLRTIEGLEKLDMSRVTYIQNMFLNCESLQNLDGISDWDTSSVEYIQYMFAGCKSLTKLDLSNWDVSNVESMNCMFSNSGLVEVKGMDNWNVAKLESASQLFYGCKNLQRVGDLNQWKVSDHFSAYSAFKGCTSLLTLPPYWAE